MLFNSFVFLALLLPTLALYWLVPRQSFRLWLLLAAVVLAPVLLRTDRDCA